MDEFIVIKVMNEAMLRLKKSKNEDCTENEKIKEFLNDKDFFLKISRDEALNVLSCVGIVDEKLDEAYQKLTRKYK